MENVATPPTGSGLFTDMTKRFPGGFAATYSQFYVQHSSWVSFFKNPHFHPVISHLLASAGRSRGLMEALEGG